jgi:hypothetical protein
MSFADIAPGGMFARAGSGELMPALRSAAARDRTRTDGGVAEFGNFPCEPRRITRSETAGRNPRATVVAALPHPDSRRSDLTLCEHFYTSGSPPENKGDLRLANYFLAVPHANSLRHAGNPFASDRCHPMHRPPCMSLRRRRRPSPVQSSFRIGVPVR